MGSFGVIELVLLLVVPMAVLVIAAFGLALAALRRVRNLERRLGGPGAPGTDAGTTRDPKRR